MDLNPTDRTSPAVPQSPPADEVPNSGHAHHLHVDEDGHVTASADLSTTGEPHGAARASLHAEAGHVTPGSHSALVDEVVDACEEEDIAHLAVSVPVGDAESLLRLRERTENMTSHAAGASVQVEADIARSPTPGVS